MECFAANLDGLVVITRIVMSNEGGGRGIRERKRIELSRALHLSQRIFNAAAQRQESSIPCVSSRIAGAKFDRAAKFLLRSHSVPVERKFRPRKRGVRIRQRAVNF